MSLVSDAEMAALREVAVSGMTTPVAIYHLVTTAGEGGRVSAYPASADATVDGWLTQLTTPNSVIGVNAGEAVITETHRLFVPVGTDLRVADKLVIGGEPFIVQSTSGTNTFQPLLSAGLRHLS